MNLLDVTAKLQTEDQCLDAIERRRWPKGIRCPQCGGERISRITRTVDLTKTRKEKKQNKRTRLYACLESTCKYRFTPTVGTIFADSHLPLVKWFAAIALIVHAKKGMSAMQIKRHLGVSYKAAWYMGHRIRKAMADGSGIPGGPKMSGTVEVDETYVGGKQKGKGVYYGKKQKAVVIGISERGRNLRLAHVKDSTAESVQPFVEANVRQDVRAVVTDEYSIYPWVLGRTGMLDRHAVIQHKTRYVAGNVHTNTVESAFSLLKRGIVGSFHRISHKHLHRYLSEFEYRFNGRELPDLFSQTLARMVNTEAMPYSQLVAE